MMKSLNVLTLLSLVSCATNYHDGVSVWRSNTEADEVLETRLYEKYVVEETPAVQNEMIADSIALDDNVSWNEIKQSSSATRSYNDVLKTVYPTAQVFKDKGECFSNLNYPAKYVTKLEKTEIVPASYEYAVIPAQYQWVKEPVKLADSNEYTYQTVKKLVSPEQKVKRVIPAEYAVSVKNGAVYEEAKTEVGSVLCGNQMTPDLVSKLQKALAKLGYGTNDISGYLNSQTLDALQSYQAANGLATGGMTLETLNALGIYSYSL